MSTIRLPRAVSRLRFSLAGLLMLMLSISVGLAWWRLPGATLAQFFYGCFAACFVVGMVQRSGEAWRGARQVSAPTPAMKMGIAVAIIAPICIALLMVLAAIMDAAIRVDWFGLDASRDSYDRFDSWILRKATNTLFCLAIVCGYWREGSAAEPRPEGSWRGVAWSTLTAVAGGLLLVLMLLSTAAVLNMVYTSLATFIDDYQPIRWAGHDFVPANVRPAGLQRAFVYGGLLSMVALVGAAAATLLLAASWRKGAMARAMTASCAIASLAIAVGLVGWCWRVALPSLSPLLAGSLTAQPPVDLWMGIVLIVSLATVGSLLATRTARERFPIAMQLHAERLPAQLWMGPPLVGISGLLWDAALAWWTRGRMWMWYTWADISYNQIEPEQLICLAALMLLCAAPWRAWKGDPVVPPSFWSIEPVKFLVVWALFATTLLMVPAVGSWFGLALMLQAGMP